jgi:hypothetical protein
LIARVLRMCVVRVVGRKIRRVENPYILDVFDESKKFCRCVARWRRGTRRARRARSSERNMWCRCTRERARPTENTGFFAAL